MRRSPTGCHDPLITSAWRSLRSSSSVASCSSWSLSRASSIFLCQSAECRFNFSHSVLTSSACFRRSRVTFWAFSSGGSSKLVIRQGFRPHSFLCLKKKNNLAEKVILAKRKRKVSQQGNLLIKGSFLLWSLAHLKSCLPE